MPASGFTFLRRTLFALTLTVISAPVLVTGASAQQAQQNIAQQFLQNPKQTLEQYPSGGPAMTSLVRELAIADPKTLEVILGLLPNANKDQKTAIGSGLGQAAKVIVRTNQAFATQILQAIAETKDQDVFLAYSGVSPDQGTAAAGGGGAGAGGGVGGQTNGLAGATTSTGGAQGIGGGSDPTSGFTYSPSTNSGQSTISSTVSQ